MRKRNIRVHVWFNEKEHEELCKKSKKAGMNKSEYLRNLILTFKPKPAPNIDHEGILIKLTKIRVKFNRILNEAHTSGFFDVEEFNKTLNELRAVSKVLIEGYTKSR